MVKKTEKQADELTPELMRQAWKVISEGAIKRYKLDGNELRMVIDDALTRAGIMWEVSYNVYKLDKMDLSYFTPEQFRTFVRAFSRAVNVLVEMKTGYSAGPFLMPNRTQRRVEQVERPRLRQTTKPRLRRSYSKRLKVKK
jgi:hypothetical protein